MTDNQRARYELWIACPECGEVIDVPFTAGPVHQDEDRIATLTFEPDMADLWAHAWTHTEENNGVE